MNIKKLLCKAVGISSSPQKPSWNRMSTARGARFWIAYSYANGPLDRDDLPKHLWTRSVRKTFDAPGSPGL